VPLWILGSSTFGAQLAAMLGLPYGFASHFAPDELLPALALYRDGFEPSAQLERPYALAGLNVVAADTDAEARRLFTSMQLAFAAVHRGDPGPYPPPVDDIEDHWSAPERQMVSHMLARSVVGSPETVRAGLERFVAETGVDEVMVVTVTHDHAARVRSYEILAEVAQAAPGTPARATARS
jgi:luciferase family oxidoreductase group 1